MTKAQKQIRGNVKKIYPNAKAISRYDHTEISLPLYDDYTGMRIKGQRKIIGKGIDSNEAWENAELRIAIMSLKTE